MTRRRLLLVGSLAVLLLLLTFSSALYTQAQENDVPQQVEQPAALSPPAPPTAVLTPDADAYESARREAARRHAEAIAQAASSHQQHLSTIAASHPNLKHLGHGHLTNPDTTIIHHGGHTHTLADAEEHGGLIFATMLVTMCIAQLALVVWKKYHSHSFDQATLAALWLFPIGYAVYHGIWTYARMITLWTIFSIICGFVMRKALTKPITRDTPRTVYSFFYWCYRISYGTAVAGYIILMMHFTGMSLLIPHFIMPSPPTAFLLGFYGLYFGVLGRDLANVCSQSMAVNMGYVARKGEIPAKTVPRNVCAICDQELIKSFRPTAEGTPAQADEPMHTLNCGHQFHDFCLRGWTMIGKRDYCPNCHEKVVLAKTMKHPWEKPSIAWAWLLDALRYMIVFNPAVLLLSQGVLYLVY